MDEEYVRGLESRCELLEESFDRLRKILVFFENEGTKIGFVAASNIISEKSVLSYFQNSSDWTLVRRGLEKYKSQAVYVHNATGKSVSVIHWINPNTPFKQKQLIEKESRFCTHDAFYQMWNIVVGGNGKGASVSFIMDIIEAEAMYNPKLGRPHG